MVLSYTTSPAYHAIAENDSNFAYAEFVEGHYPQVEVAGIVASSPDRALAAEFLQYLVSPTAQAIIPVTNWMYPVAEPATPLPEPLLAGMRPEKVLGLDEAAIAANKGQWIADALAELD